MKNRLLLLFLLIPFVAFTQRISGYVSSSENMPLAYATVSIENSTFGVATNLKGYYQLDVKPGMYNLVFQIVGFETVKKQVEVKGTNIQLNVQLTEKITELGEVVVSAKQKDPAYAIMKQVVANKNKFKNGPEIYSVDAYIKSSLEKEFNTHDTMSKELQKELPNELTRENMNFYESVSTLYYSAPNKYKEIKKAVNEFSDKVDASASVEFNSFDDFSVPEEAEVNPWMFKLDLIENQINFYENSLLVPGLGSVELVSPTSPLAVTNYEFKLLESFYDGTYWIKKIEVTPRRNEISLVSGILYVVDGLFCIKALDITVNPNAAFTFKNFRIMQDYEQQEDSSWVLSREEFFYNSKDGKKRIIGNTIIQYKNYNLQPKISKQFFNNALSIVADSAYKYDSTYWMKMRPIELKPAEQLFVRNQDSIKSYHSSDDYLAQQDSTYNHHNIWDYLLNGIGWRKTKANEKQVFFINPLISQMYIFGVGGYRHAPGGSFMKQFKTGKELNIDGTLNYGFKNNDLKGLFNFSYLFNPKNRGEVHFSGRNVFELLNSYESFQAVLARGNYINERFISFGYQQEVINGLYANLTFEFGEKRPLTDFDLEDWSTELFGAYNTPTDFDAFTETVLDVQLKYVVKQQYKLLPDRKVVLPPKFPIVLLKFRKGIPGLFNSTINYDYLELSFTDKISVGSWGESKIRGFAGTFLNAEDLRITDYRFFRRSDEFLFSNPLQSFQLLRPGTNAISTRNPFAMLNYVHRFNGKILGKVPLINRLGMQTAAGAGYLYIQDMNFNHAELFGGIELPFRIRNQLFKIGGFYCVGYSNVSNFSNEFKIGLDFFNNWTKEWSY